MTGHVSRQLPGSNSLLVNPWGYWWRAVRAADVLEVNLDGTVIGGTWDVTPAIHIHTELHRRRSDARVVVHSHSLHAAVLAAVPEIVHQNSSILAGEMVLVNDYDGFTEDDGTLPAGPSTIAESTRGPLAQPGAAAGAHDRPVPLQERVGARRVQRDDP